MPEKEFESQLVTAQTTFAHASHDNSNSRLSGTAPYYLPGNLENQIGAFVDHYDNRGCCETIGNITKANAYFGCQTAIIEKK